MGRVHWGTVALLAFCLSPRTGEGQVDPKRRDLVEAGYSGSLEGSAPITGYAFYYLNRPDFPGTNETFRLALGPTYLDSELGFRDVLPANTDLGINFSGGGYRDTYHELRGGKFVREESFDGFRAQTGLSLYHLFNPGYLIPLYGVLNPAARFVMYDSNPHTAPNFVVPDERGIFTVRTGFRWGGRPMALFPDKAMELSIWYEGYFRTDPQTYGFGDRQIEAQSHLFWANAYLAYHLFKWKHQFAVNVTAGTTIDADRLSAYRLGGFLPLASEFPLSLPGYFYQELSAKDFVLFGGNYTIPVSHNRRWNINLMAATAYVDYLPGLEQPGHWNSGVGGGLFYTSKVWRVLLDYGYGIDATRSHGRGANAIYLLLQLDLGSAKEAYKSAQPPGLWRGLQQILGS